MAPALLPGDWLLLDPTTSRWPRPGTVVIVREPGSGLLAIKRVAARGGGLVTTASGESLALGPDEAWLLGDDPSVSVDSRQYGAVPLAALVARAWFRYWPRRRIGRLAPPPGRLAPPPGRLAPPPGDVPAAGIAPPAAPRSSGRRS
jgi:hypothetical protein